MLRAGFRPGFFLRNNLLVAYCRGGDMRHTHLLFNGMPRRDAVSWNTLITGYSIQSGSSVRLALASFRDARGGGGRADRFSYAAVLAACGRAGD
ncbi:pentatricopeptide repeat-containing protein [Hordeum vulgare]|nr:pentatricopeptide repeat-containing protein [Hordeum vulgare]